MTTQVTPTLPLAVHVGFAGPRRLPTDDRGTAAIETLVRDGLHSAMSGLHEALGLSGQHFCIGVSQLAAGADTLFAEIAADLGWLHRVLLPQPAPEFLAAAGSAGPDFNPKERARVEALLARPHIADVAVASTASSRAERFSETSRRILRECDVLVVVVVDGAPSRPGSAAELLERARARGLCRLVLTLGTGADGCTQLSSAWETPVDRPFGPPSLPECVQAHAAALPWRGPAPDMAEAFANRVKEAGSRAARSRQRFFRYAASIVVLTHVLATAAALIAIKMPETGWAVLAVLGLEVFLLSGGLWTHRSLHQRKSTRNWAMARLCAEIARSAIAVRGVRMPLVPREHHALPAELKALMRTMSVLHLHASRSQPASWPGVRERYVQERLLSTRQGQLGYFEREARRSHQWAHAASAAFSTLSIGAMAATVLKFGQIASGAGAASVVGVMAVLLPVAAVGIMSMASALDLEAREHTFQDMLDFSRHRVAEILASASPQEFADMAAETEAGLMTEAISWVGRRSYLGIS